MQSHRGKRDHSLKKLLEVVGGSCRADLQNFTSERGPGLDILSGGTLAGGAGGQDWSAGGA